MPHSTSDVCFGEQPLSFRALCKRYASYLSRVATVSGSAHNATSMTTRIIPGPSPSYGSTTIGSDATPTLLRTLLYAYLGVKGGMRKKVRYTVTGEVLGFQSPVYVQLNGLSNAMASEGSVSFTNAVTPAVFNGYGGNISIPHTNAGIEVELPYYSPNLFHFAFNSNGDTGTDQYEMNHYWVRNFTTTFDSSALTGTGIYSQEYATAEDFSLMRFNGAPYFSYLSG